jgi:hypothetical protein
VFSAGAVAAGLAPRLGVLIGARVVQGLGAAVGLTRIERDGMAGAVVLGPLGLGLALLAAFVTVERRGSAPLVRLDILRARSLGAGYRGAFLAAAVLSLAGLAAAAMSRAHATTGTEATPGPARVCT